MWVSMLHSLCGLFSHCGAVVREPGLPCLPTPACLASLPRPLASLRQGECPCDAVLSVTPTRVVQEYTYLEYLPSILAKKGCPPLQSVPDPLTRPGTARPGTARPGPGTARQRRNGRRPSLLQPAGRAVASTHSFNPVLEELQPAGKASTHVQSLDQAHLISTQVCGHTLSSMNGVVFKETSKTAIFE